MRTAIREKLISEIPEICGRVFEPHAAGAKTPKPYLVLRNGVDVEDTPWTNFRRIIEVWPYLPRTSFKDVDTMTAKIAVALDKQLLNTSAGEVFSCLYLGAAGQDFVDIEWDAITRGLRFSVMALQPVTVPETVVNDPWLDALTAWTEDLLGWTVYKNYWPMGYVRPSVLWRLTDIKAEHATRSAYKVIKKISGHIVGSTPNEEVAGVFSIVQGLITDIKIPLDMATRKYMTAESPIGDYKVNALTKGQISVTLSRMTNRPTEEVPLMTRVFSRGQLK